MRRTAVSLLNSASSISLMRAQITTRVMAAHGRAEFEVVEHAPTVGNVTGLSFDRWVAVDRHAVSVIARSATTHIVDFHLTCPGS